MTVYKGYMKIIKQNKGMILLYLIIFSGITAYFPGGGKKRKLQQLSGGKCKDRSGGRGWRSDGRRAEKLPGKLS